MKILLLGKDGQVGHELRHALSSLGELVACGRSEADLTRTDELVTLVWRERPDVIVNAAAYTAVDKAESEPDLAARINAHAVAVLAREAKAVDAWLVHYSTDYVFDGERQGAYREDDPTTPLNVYGRTKLAGEDAIQASGCRYLVFRTSWVYGTHGHNFVKTILRLAAERDELNVVVDQRGAPTSAELIAAVTARAITAAVGGAMPPGIYHLAPTGETTWHGFAQRIVRLACRAGLALRLTSEGVRPIATEAYPTPARRPRNSRLDTSRLADVLGLTLPDWRDDVSRTVERLVTEEIGS